MVLKKGNTPFILCGVCLLHKIEQVIIFPFTINWLIYHFSAPFYFMFAQINERSWRNSIFCSFLTNLVWFSSLRCTKLNYSLRVIWSYLKTSIHDTSSSTLLCNVILHIFVASTLLQRTVLDLKFFYLYSVHIQYYTKIYQSLSFYILFNVIILLSAVISNAMQNISLAMLL